MNVGMMGGAAILDRRSTGCKQDFPDYVKNGSDLIVIYGKLRPLAEFLTVWVNAGGGAGVD
jgi:hypothetical protein